MDVHLQDKTQFHKKNYFVENSVHWHPIFFCIRKSAIWHEELYWSLSQHVYLHSTLYWMELHVCTQVLVHAALALISYAWHLLLASCACTSQLETAECMGLSAAKICTNMHTRTVITSNFAHIMKSAPRGLAKGQEQSLATPCAHKNSCVCNVSVARCCFRGILALRFKWTPAMKEESQTFSASSVFVKSQHAQMLCMPSFIDSHAASFMQQQAAGHDFACLKLKHFR